ncbi:hypothetical protein [Vulcanococcus sp. Clear-D1]|uniref:hypothetical protein n=1 Tax=Vulcanococcus sp. Clear-D1 TaxID=2766970 RepID=UPI001990F963|nr:hypothetical protein [Vulcanococcus sp. Clear-D1]MBD1192606.1 hypothetical protein [Vulcanococcus sp. Clear-D1]
MKLRWPITVLALGAMLMGLLSRSSQHPIQLRLVLSFAEPLTLSGQVKGLLDMPDPVDMRHAGGVKVQVTEQSPVKLSVNNPKPIQVEVSNPNPIQIDMSEQQPMEVDVQPKAPVKVKIGL